MAASSCTIVGEMERAVSAKILFTKNRDCVPVMMMMMMMIKDISFHFRGRYNHTSSILV